MKKNLLLLNLALFFLFSGHAIAQKHYNVEHFNGDNGLPQNSVKTIFADAEGFIWLGTEDGLVRYNGAAFDIFNRFNLNVKDTRVMFAQPALRESPAQKKNLSYKRGRNAVTYIYLPGTEVVRVENGTAVRDTIYYKQDFDHLKRFRRKNRISFQSTGVPNFVNTMLPLSRYMIRAGNDDKNMFICDSAGINRFESWKQKFRTNFQSGSLWNYFSLGNNLYYYDNRNKSITSFIGKNLVTQSLSGDIIKNPFYLAGKKSIQLYWNNVSDQAYLYIDTDLYKLSPQKDGTLTTTLLVEDFDLLSRGIEEVHYDESNGKIYLGSVTDGLYILSKQHFTTINIKGDFRENVFYGLQSFGENSVLTADGRIVGKNISDGKNIDKQLLFVRNINSYDKETIAKDRDGNVWTKKGGVLFWLDLKSNKIRGTWRFRYNVETIYYDNVCNEIWVGSSLEGLFKLNLNTSNVSLVKVINQPLFNSTIIRSQNLAYLLVGTTAGLYRIDIGAKKSKLIIGTEKLYIKGIFADAQKNIWITSLEKGLMLLKPDDCLVNFPLDDNKYLASPHSIMHDGNHLWIPTNRGLFQMSVRDLISYADGVEKVKHNTIEPNAVLPSELFYVYHTKEEGFNTNEFNGCDHCGVKLANGNMVLPSLNGLVWFRPANIKEDKADGNIILDKAEVNRKAIKPWHDTLYFPVDPGHIKLHFLTAYFGNSYNLKLSYVLVKENRAAKHLDWIPMDKDFDVEFSNLNSGNYTLIIRKLNGFGVNNYNIKKIYFIIPPLWYQTVWANILFFCILLGLIYFYNRYNLRAVKRENAKLEAIVSRRTSRLNKTLSDLEASKNEMTRQVHMLSRLLTSMTHDIQSPLNYISLVSSSIPKLVHRGEFSDVMLMGEVISNTSKRMSNLLKGLLDYIKVHVFENSLHFESINLKQLVDEKFEIFINMITENGSEFRNDVPVNVQVFCDYQMLGIMIHNLIDNAAKFTRNGEIRIYYQINDENDGELVISNTTVGVPREIQDMINAQGDDEEPIPTLTGQTRTSLGLLIVKEIAALVGISLRVSQTTLTSFYLTFKKMSDFI